MIRKTALSFFSLSKISGIKPCYKLLILHFCIALLTKLHCSKCSMLYHKELERVVATVVLLLTSTVYVSMCVCVCVCKNSIHTYLTNDRVKFKIIYKKFKIKV